MEDHVNQILDKVMANPAHVGCLLANNQGLCIGARGKASDKSAGIIVAISEQAAKLDPNCNAPVVSLEAGDKVCIIHKNGLTGAVYKQK
ncbi:ragulator complex protein LAMTOR5-like [Culex pipiens pallens]|uniref:ragulator complex protein LAMTOR5-like n=1 Tax=Culex pipiens pallens TaxID=42434 RepID=UPI00195372A7|nr:ragulator complex protein LAMTOR5-like [Culex pipiens pallens]